MKEEDKIRKELGTENPFRVPEGYFEGFTSDLMSRLPEKEKAGVYRVPTMWEKVRPWVYMAAMFVGAALIIRVASSRVEVPAGEQTPVVAEEVMDAETEMEYIDVAIDNSMLDDYSLYVYLADDGDEQ